MKTKITIKKLRVSKMILLAFSIVSMNASAQNASAPDLIATYNFTAPKTGVPGVTWDNERINAMKPTLDGGFIAVGSARGVVIINNTTYYDRDCFIVKFDNNGNQEFSFVSPSGVGYDEFFDVTETDAGFVAVGYSHFNGPKQIRVTTYIDEGMGMEITNYMIGAVPPLNSLGTQGNSIAATADGGFILGCTVTERFSVIKLNSLFDEEWEFEGPIPNTSIDGVAFSVQQTSDDEGYIVAGAINSQPSSSSNFYVARIDKSGLILWDYQATDGGYATSVMETQDGGFIAAGVRADNGDDMKVIRFRDTGPIGWIAHYGGTVGDQTANSIIQTLDGGFVLAGYSTNSDGTGDVSQPSVEEDCWVVRINDLGTIVWEKSLGGVGFDVATAVAQTSDSEYMVAGYSWSTLGGDPEDAMVYHLDATLFDYCNSNPISSKDHWISNVTLGSINQSSKANGYTDYRKKGQTTVLNDGNNIINVQISNNPIAIPSNYYTTVFVDFNHNGSFDNDERFDIPLNSTSDAIPIPSNAVQGVTTMRVVMQAFPQGNPKQSYVKGPCGTFKMGEVEDYKVDIQPNILGPSPRLSQPETTEPMSEKTLGLPEMTLGLPYPNPASQVVTIPVHGGAEIGVASVILRDVSGRVVSQTNYKGSGVFNKELAVDVSRLPVGYYFCEVTVNNTWKKTVKVSVTH